MTSEEKKSRDDIVAAPVDLSTDFRRSTSYGNETKDDKGGKKQSSAKAVANFLFDPKRKTVLGRDSLNWAKLSAFYTVFYFFLGCFFVGLVYVFASVLDRTTPRYYNTESTMAIRSAAAVVGMGFRPQVLTDNSLIQISNDPIQQKRIASSLRLFRDVFLLQNSDAKVEECSVEEPASQLPLGTACQFSWSSIVQNDAHPCSDNNMHGFKYEQPCVLVKLNKVYGWTPIKGPLPVKIQQLRGVLSNKSVSNSDVYITCEGSNVADNDVLTNATYYSVTHPLGSTKYGVVPNYFFPYRNAKDHVQPFVLVQFNKLPLNRLVSVTCRAWAPGIEHDTKGMRGMVTFQLYRSNTNLQADDDDE